MLILFWASVASAADGTTPLHLAARDGDLARVETLIAAGADANATSRLGVTPLSLAVQAGAPAVVARLLRAGASVEKAEAGLPDRQTLLMHAAAAGDVDTIRLLAQRAGVRQRVDAREARAGTTALIWATVADEPDAIQALAAVGAAVDLPAALTEYPHTPPAVIGDPLEPGVSYVGQTVLPKGAWTPLLYAAREGAAAATAALLDAGASLESADPDGTTALILAIINGHQAVASLLLARGADPNHADRTGMTPLYAAVDIHTVATTFGRPAPPPTVIEASGELARNLLARGANPNARLRTRILKRVYNPGDPRLGEGATPFMRAARGADVELMRLLLEHGADPSLAQANGNTPLLLAAAVAPGGTRHNPDRASVGDAIAALTLCISAGADVNAANSSGDTAVHVAATSNLGSPAVLQFLWEHGADMRARNNAKRTPLEAALRNREIGEPTVTLLRELQDRPSATTNR